MGPEHDDEEVMADNAKERSMSIKLKVENTMRWRWTKDENGNDVSASQASSVSYAVIQNYRSANPTLASLGGLTDLSASV